MTASDMAERGARPAALDDDAFWAELRARILPLRPSQYDLTSRCNLTCEGCLFFSGSEYRAHADEGDAARVEAFFRGERDRGVRYGYFGGAEPSLVEGKLMAAARSIPYGVIFTNGTRRLTDAIAYRVHVSVWGRPEQSRRVRGAGMLGRQTRNYRGDGRAVFVFTISSRTIDDIPWIAAHCADHDLALSFNHYSPTHDYSSYLAGDLTGDAYHARSSSADNLILTPRDLARSQDLVARAIEDHPRVLYSHAMNAILHEPAGLYPELDADGLAQDCGVRLTNALRHHNTDLSASTAKCCTPNVACGTCRLYAQSYATLLLRATRDLRKTRRPTSMTGLWRLWCALFLNDDRLNRWPVEAVAPVYSSRCDPIVA